VEKSCLLGKENCAVKSRIVSISLANNNLQKVATIFACLKLRSFMWHRLFFFIHSCTPQHFGIFIYNFSFSFIFSGKTYAGKVLTPCSVSAGEKNKNHLIQFSTYLAPFGGWEFSKGSEWNFSRYREPCKSFSSLSKAPQLSLFAFGLAIFPK